MSDELKPYDEKAAQARRLAILSELAQSRIGDSLKTPAVSAQISAQTSAPPSPEAKQQTPTAPWRAPKSGRRDLVDSPDLARRVTRAQLRRTLSGA